MRVNLYFSFFARRNFKSGVFSFFSARTVRGWLQFKTNAMSVSFTDFILQLMVWSNLSENNPIPNWFCTMKNYDCSLRIIWFLTFVVFGMNKMYLLLNVFKLYTQGLNNIRNNVGLQSGSIRLKLRNRVSKKKWMKMHEWYCVNGSRLCNAFSFVF